MTDHSLNRRTALVTGASSGFGHHFVEHLAGQGILVYKGNPMRFVTHLDISSEDIDRTVAAMGAGLE